MHELAAGALGTPELKIGKVEGDALEKALANVARHYGVQATQKTLDHAALLMTLGGIYGPKFAFIAARKKAEREPKQPARPPFSVVNNGSGIPTNPV